MKKLFTLSVIFLLPAMAHAQIMGQDEAIRQAKAQAEISSPPMNASQMEESKAVYMSNENAWIVDFSEEDPAPADSDYMLRVEATSGKTPELLSGSQKDRYRSYFTSASNGDENPT